MDIEGAEMKIIETIEIKLKKLVFEWSFDVDDNIDRYRNAVEKVSKQFVNVHAGQVDAKHKVWLKSWFPPCKNVYCYQ